MFLPGISLYHLPLLYLVDYLTENLCLAALFFKGCHLDGNGHCYNMSFVYFEDFLTMIIIRIYFRRSL